ncbi:hypothetical protein [Planobispora rosea]|uniref:hypothetical protein n=1 Tax=Planobispora rosea TaxID=35762 RepID=UPI001C4011B5|nr:hypothetical protein [Planobispora rosea]
MKALITVKAAPNPSEAYGETVCVAALRLDLDHPGWIRLYPINFRELDGGSQFRKYDVVSLEAKPSPSDPRAESRRPRSDSFVEILSLDIEPHPGWTHAEQRKIEQYVQQLGLFDAAPRTALQAPGSRRGTATGVTPPPAPHIGRESTTGSWSRCSAT